MACTIKAITNGNKSLLGEKLYQISNKDQFKSDIFYKFFTSDQFVKDFGDWQADYKIKNIDDRKIDQQNVDVNGEPILFLDKDSNRHFYINKYNERRYYPLQLPNRELNGLYTNEEISSVARTLGLKFIEPLIKKGFMDIDFDVELGSLRGFIESEISRRSQELKGSKITDMDDSLSFREKSIKMMREISRGNTLEQSLKHVNEWEQAIKDFYRGNKLKLDTNEPMTQQEIDADTTRGEQAYGSASFERTTRETVGNDVKLALSLLPDANRIDPIFQEPQFVKFDEVYSTILKELEGITALEGQDIYDLYRQKLIELQDKKPYISELLNLLDNASEEVRSRFVQAFNLGKNEFYTTLYTKTSLTGYGETVPVITYEFKFVNLSGAADNSTSVKNNWFYNFKENFANPDGTYSVDNAKFEKITKDINFLIANQNRLTISEGAYRNEFLRDVMRLLEDLGIDLDIHEAPDGTIRSSRFEHFMDNLQPTKQSDAVRNASITKLLTSLNFLNTQSFTEARLNSQENVFNDQTVFNDLAKSELFFSGDNSDSSIFAGEKTKYIYSYRNHLSNQLTSFQNNPLLLTDKMKAGSFYEGSGFMNAVLGKMNLKKQKDESDEAFNTRKIEAAQNLLNQFKITTFNTFQREGEALNSVDAKSISLLDLTSDTINKSLAYRKKSGKSILTTPIPAEKGTLLQFEIPSELIIDTQARLVDGQIDMSDYAVLTIYNLALSEYNRIKEVKKQIEQADGDTSRLVTNYHISKDKKSGEWTTDNANGLQFQLFPSLNTFGQKDANGKLLNPDNAFLYTDGVLNTNLKFEKVKDIYDIAELAQTNKHTYDFVRYVENRIKQNIQETLDHFEKFNLFEKIDKEIFDSYDGDLASKKVNIVADAVINNLNFAAEYSKMFSGDYAYYKNMDDYKKRVPSAYTDGLYLRLYKDDPVYFNMATIENVEISAHDFGVLEKNFGKEIADYYKSGIDSTDAQSWITPERWKFLTHRMGKWTKTHDAVWEKMHNNEGPEVYTAAEHRVLAQPLKGVYFDVVNGIPTFLKYSQAVLTDALVSNIPELASLREAMLNGTDENGNKRPIDELVTLSGVKVGSLRPIRTHTEDGRIMDNIRLQGMNLKNASWKLQQDLSPKGFGKTDIGAQMQQMVFAALSGPQLNGNYTTIRGEQLSGAQLASRIHGLASTMSTEGLQDFKNRIGADESGYIASKETMYESILDSLLDRNSTPENVLKALKANINPYAIVGFSETLQQSISSKVKDSVVRIKTNGGSFIQMADYGFTKDIANDKGVMWTPWSDDKLNMPRVSRDENGEARYNEYYSKNKETGEFETTRKEIIEPGSVFIPGSIISKILPEWRQLSPEKIFGTKENNFEDGLIDQKILQTLVGYRIPTQGLASTDALQVAGILPDSVSDTIIAYTGITTKTGSDYDIDKMYLMMPDIKIEYDNKVKLHDYVFELLKGKTVKDTILNIRDTIKLIDPDYILTTNNDLLSDTITNKERLEELSFLMGEIVQMIYKNDTPAAVLFKEKIAELSKPTKIRYDSESLATQLVESYHAALLHPDVMDQILTPIDFPYMRADIENLVPQAEAKDLQSFGMISELKLRLELMVGTIGVGAAANAGKDHQRGLFTNDNSTIAGAILDRPFSEKLSREDLEYYSEVAGIPLNEIDKYESFRVADTISSILNAFVDIANDNYITRANWNTRTFGVGLMLIRAGQHPFKVNAFLSNPTIKEFIEFSNYNEAHVVGDTGQMFKKFKEVLKSRELEGMESYLIEGKEIRADELFEIALKSSEGVLVDAPMVKAKFGVLPSAEQLKNIMSDLTKVHFNFGDGIRVKDAFIQDYELSKLRTMMEEGVGSKDNYSAFEMFELYTKLAKEVSQGIRAAKPDTDSYGKDISELLVSKNTLYKALTSEILLGFESKLSFEGNPTYLMTMLENALFKVNDIMRSNPAEFVEAHSTVQNTFNLISKLTGRGIATNADAIRKISNSYYSYMMSGFEPFQMGKEQRDSLLGGINEQVKDLKAGEFKNNEFVKRLEPITGMDGKSYIGMRNKKMPKETQDAITNGWKDLFDVDPIAAEDLIKYSFLTSGFQNTLYSFHKFIPFEYLAENNINEYINKHTMELNTQSVDLKFVEMFFRHNLRDTMLTRQVFDSQLSFFEGVSGRVGFKLKDKNDEPNYIVRREVESYDNQGLPSTDFEYYKLIGLDSFNRAIYKRTNHLGYVDARGIRVTEFDKYSSRTVSEMDSNKLVINNFSKESAILESFVDNTSVLDLKTTETMEFMDSYLEKIRERYTAVKPQTKVDEGVPSKEELGIIEGKQSDLPC